MRISNINTLNYIIAVPLIVMSYHIYTFFETEPWPLRVSLAVSFDILVIACFYLLKDKLLMKKPEARRAIWLALLVLISFQLYVNIWAYWELHPVRAVASGSIFPIVVGLITYVSTHRQAMEEKQARRKIIKPTDQTPKNQSSALSNPVSPAPEKERPWKGQLVPKEAVASSFMASGRLETFKGARNWKSAKIWWGKLEKGEEI